MYGIVQQFFPVAFIIVWLGGLGILALRSLQQQLAYYQRFAWLDRTKAMWQRQADPASERLRRAVWRGYGYGLLWGLGFPLLMTGALWLITASGYLHIP